MVKEDRNRSPAFKAHGSSVAKVGRGTMADYEDMRSTFEEEAKAETPSPTKGDSKQTVKLTKLYIGTEIAAVAISGGYGYGDFLKGKTSGCIDTGNEKSIPPKVHTWVGDNRNNDIGPPYYRNALRCVTLTISCVNSYNFIETNTEQIWNRRLGLRQTYGF